MGRGNVIATILLFYLGCMTSKTETQRKYRPGYKQAMKLMQTMQNKKDLNITNETEQHTERKKKNRGQTFRPLKQSVTI